MYTVQLSTRYHVTCELRASIAAMWVATHTDKQALSPFLNSSDCEETGLHELALASQDLVGYRPLLSCVQNYCDCQIIMLRKGESTIWASTK